MSSKINIWNLEIGAQDCYRAVEGVHQALMLASVEDKQTKTRISISELLHATDNLNLPNMPNKFKIDGEGHNTLEGTHVLNLYHTQDTWKELGLTRPGRDLYPSIIGTDLYPCLRTFEAAQNITRLPGRMLEIM